MLGTVSALHRSPEHGFSKAPCDSVRLLAGLGVEGDAHCGATVRHRSRVAVDPSQPNLRQVCLLEAEVLDELGAAGFGVGPGDLGENVTTRGLPLASLPTGTVLRIGGALVALTGQRNPCAQIERFEPGLLAAVREGSAPFRRGGALGVVLLGGDVAVGDAVEASLPPGAPVPLARV